jgi:hypothetical protein
VRLRGENPKKVVSETKSCFEKGEGGKQMKKVILIALVMALVGGAAYANYCARDYVPANTLLVPFVRVAMAPGWTAPDTTGYTTLFAITNVSQEAQIVHISTYSILSEKFIDFDVILSGYDVITMNFRDIIAGHLDLLPNGGQPDFTKKMQLKTTVGYSYTPFKFGPGYTGLVPNDLGSGATLVSQDRNQITNIATLCAGRFPYAYYPEILSTYAMTILMPPLAAWTHPGCAPTLARLDRANDWLKNLTAAEAWLYAYADVVTACNNEFPTNDTYWTPTLYMANRNVLIGDVIYLNQTANASESIPAVSVEYNGNTGMVNFYDYSTTDALGVPQVAYSGLEPLATAFAFRYANDTVNNVSSKFILWKNFTETNPLTMKVNDCQAYVYYAWDEDEFSVSPGGGGCPYSPCPTLQGETNETPFQTQAVPLTNTNWDLAGAYGWMLYIMPPAFAPFTYDPAMTAPYWYMGYAGVTYNYGTYSTMLDAATMANTHCFANQVLQPVGIIDLGINALTP